jgi:hypothetical protein
MKRRASVPELSCREWIKWRKETELPYIQPLRICEGGNTSPHPSSSVRNTKKFFHPLDSNHKCTFTAHPEAAMKIQHFSQLLWVQIIRCVIGLLRNASNLNRILLHSTVPLCIYSLFYVVITHVFAIRFKNMRVTFQQLFNYVDLLEKRSTICH